MNVDQPVVSVILPARNAAATLTAALRSIQEQTLTAWELVAVDDGSTDATAQMLERAAGEDPRIRIVTQSALGIAEALRLGCARARGPFIARMDADDTVSPARLERQLEYLQAHPGVGVASCLVEFGGDPVAQAGYAAHVDWINAVQTPEAMRLRRFVESPVAHPSVMFRRELMERHGSYRAGDFPEDYELWLRWMDAGVEFGKVPERLLTWNDSAERLSREDARYSTEAFYRVKCHYLARWIRRSVGAGREIWLWGAGRVTRRRFELLEQEGIRIAGFVDIDVKKQGRLRDGRPVVGPDQMPRLQAAFIVVGVASRGARELIGADLARRGYREGIDFLLAA